MMTDAQLRYITTGGNRHPSAADWSNELLAYGAGNNIALWNPADGQHAGVSTILRGHTNSVNAIQILESPSIGLCIISGSNDSSIRVWQSNGKGHFGEWKVLSDHTASVNTISTISGSDIFVSGAADGTVKLWRLSQAGVDLLQSISLKPKFIPLATALVELASGAVVLAVAGTLTSIQVYAGSLETALSLQATLTGHEGWVRSLDFQSQNGIVMLASTSQDRYIRLWKLQESSGNSQSQTTMESLSNKLYRLACGDRHWVMSYDALLVGHEDWVYTARWAPSAQEATLLSASADNSLSIWRREEGSGLWICETRLGEISSLKGSTTATGSTGGFWIGLWSPDGKSVASLSRTGSWRLWSLHETSWQQQTGVSGHVREVQSVSWANDGSYLLSTSSDQTTRLWAEWKTELSSWHEMARPQIHGYDLNCVTTVTRNQFVSGADEKLLRVFNKPRGAEKLLSSLAGLELNDEELPESANIPVLGLSNKAVIQDENEEAAPAPALDKPPVEDTLARHTLWPEHEKLYGHGYEISAVAVNCSGSLIATACKASTLNHAVIRLYETKEWREVKPALSAHTLTVTSLAFSRDDAYLLSVGRDRQWALFQKADTTYEPCTANLKGHSRMILDCSWASSDTFATAGRDKVVKIWQISNGSIEQLTSIIAQAAVTAVAFSTSGTRLLYGTEDGDLVVASTVTISSDHVDRLETGSGRACCSSK
ncbi:hypothetical protein AMS68_000009 [Peltaster fructicola]|uniref:Elongator complex protein 2 n=1 Tax=Peltaster fructicola TaxID=286661 RepID=A0A6H0XIF1_9PEZI|nr:hypothetical protein AMS68_000009 [Peltaster fructicola]